MNHLPYFTNLLRLTISNIFFLNHALSTQKVLQVILISSCLLLKVTSLSAKKAVLVIDYLRDNIPIQQQSIHLQPDSSINQYIPVKLQLGEKHTLLFQVKLPQLATLSDLQAEFSGLPVQDDSPTQPEIKQTTLLDSPHPSVQTSCGSTHLFEHSLSIMLLIYGLFYLLKEGNNYWQAKKVKKSKPVTSSDEFSDKEEKPLPSTSSSHKEEVSSTPSEFSMEEINWLVNLQQTVEQNMSNIYFDIEQLANDLAISSRHLNRRIRSYTGFSTHQYIQETRLTTAKSLLEAQAYRSVKAVAYEVGYKDVKYFGQLYKKRFGRLPSTYFKK